MKELIESLINQGKKDHEIIEDVMKETGRKQSKRIQELINHLRSVMKYKLKSKICYVCKKEIRLAPIYIGKGLYRCNKDKCKKKIIEDFMREHSLQKSVEKVEVKKRKTTFTGVIRQCIEENITSPKEVEIKLRQLCPELLFKYHNLHKSIEGVIRYLNERS